VSVGEVPALPPDLPAELRRQAERCRPTAPLYAGLLGHLAEDAEQGGVTADLLRPYAAEPLATVPGLRLMGAVHRLVLEGRLPELMAFFPSVGGHADPEAAWPVLHRALAEHTDELLTLLELPVQTNETGRAAALYGGLLVVATRTGLPVRLLEIGASAGLNLRADRFCYRLGHRAGPAAAGAVLGDPAGRVVLEDPWQGTPPAPLGTVLRVAERRGCDPRPLDPTTPEGRLRLTASVWADDTARLERTRAAIALATRVPATIDAAPAERWLPERLAAPVPGTATVVWHSVVRQYVAPDAWARVGRVLDEAGARATDQAPLAHLALEPEVAPDGTYRFALRLTTWPGGGSEELGTAPGHGVPVTWA